MGGGKVDETKINIRTEKTFVFYMQHTIKYKYQPYTQQ